MERGLCRAERDVDGAHAAESRRDGRRSLREVPEVCDNDGVALQEFCMFSENLFEACASGFFFAFDDELEVRTIALEFAADLFKCGEMHADAGLVVSGAASKEAVAFLRGRKRRRVPQSFSHGRLHVVMRVQKDGRLVRACKAFGVNARASAWRHQKLDVGESRFLKHRLDGVRAVQNVLLVEIVKTDGGDGYQA